MMHVHRSERMYMIASIVLLVIFSLAVGISGFVYGIQLPQPEAKVDPRTIATPGASQYPFGDPVAERVRELAPGKYEVYILAQMWKYSPGSVFYGEPAITIPVGSTVTFYVTSKDVQHGFKIQNTNVSFMVLPGEVSTLTATFDEPGEYTIVCHEYCGTAHQTMFGKIIVE